MLSTLGRLLWKEFREGWLVVLVSVVAPVFSLRILTSESIPDTQRSIVFVIGMMVTPVVVMLWAIRKGGQRRQEGKAPLVHLPVHCLIDWSVSILLPLAISVLIGFWVGGHLPSDGPHALKPEIHQTGVRLAMLYVPAAFVGCYVISAAISAWAGLLAGFAWTIFGLAWMPRFWQINGSQSASQSLTDFLSRTALGAALCLALFLLLSHKKRVRVGRFASMILLAAIIFVPIIRDLINPTGSAYPQYWDAKAYSSDRSLLMRQQRPTVRGKVDTDIEMTNYASGWSSTRTFKGYACPIAFDSTGCGYVAQQDPKSRWVRVFAWNRSEIKEIARIPARAGAVRYRAATESWGSVSPDRRYMAFAIGSRMGLGVDMWVVNLRNGDSWIVLPNTYGPDMHVSWQTNRLVLPGRDEIRAVNLRTKVTGKLRIPGEDGG